MKKGVGSGVGSGSISQRYGSGDVTDPQRRCLLANIKKKHIPAIQREAGL